jgi:hypothetical protein
MSSGSSPSWQAGAEVALQHRGFVDLPAHAKAGGFDRRAGKARAGPEGGTRPDE